MSAAWKHLEGHVINGALPLLRCIASSDQSGVFLTESATYAPAAVALKLVRVDPTSADAQLLRLLAAASLSHPHLIRIFEAGQCQIGEQHLLYALMEHADQSLAQLLGQRVLTEHEVREMLAPTLNVLAYLHEKKFVLGQLKPSNILAVGDELKLASDTVRAAGEPSGSMTAASAYDAPEARAGLYSAASDIWALGVTLCEALTRRQPSGLHEGAGALELPSDLQPPFREVVARCLSKEPRDRPRVADLQAWLRGELAIGAAAATAEPAATPLQHSSRAESAADQPGPAEPAAAQAAQVKTTEPQAAPPAIAESQSDTASRLRLVIRAEILPKEPPQTTLPPRWNRPALALALGAVAVLALIWIGINVLRTDPTSALAPSEEARTAQSQAPVPAPAPSESTRAAGDATTRKPAASTGETASTDATSGQPGSTEPKSVAPATRDKPEAPSPIKEVIPDVPQSALQTIRGTIRVAVRVTIDKEGTVLATTSEIPGPSRYFERLSLEAAKKWTFTPADAQGPRMMRVRFYYTRAQASAKAEPVQ